MSEMIQSNKRHIFFGISLIPAAADIEFVYTSNVPEAYLCARRFSDSCRIGTREAHELL